jgi:hypothetical protein
MLPVFVTLTGWFWPKKEEQRTEERPPEEVTRKHGEQWLKLQEHES